MRPGRRCATGLYCLLLVEPEGKYWWRPNVGRSSAVGWLTLAGDISSCPACRYAHDDHLVKTSRVRTLRQKRPRLEQALTEAKDIAGQGAPRAMAC